MWRWVILGRVVRGGTATVYDGVYAASGGSTKSPSFRGQFEFLDFAVGVVDAVAVAREETGYATGVISVVVWPPDVDLVVKLDEVEQVGVARGAAGFAGARGFARGHGCGKMRGMDRGTVVRVT